MTQRSLELRRLADQGCSGVRRLASSGAEVCRSGLAGALIKLFGAPLALAVDALLLLVSAAILRGIQVKETLSPSRSQDFWTELKAGLHFVRERRLLVSLASACGGCLGVALQALRLQRTALQGSGRPTSRSHLV